MARHGPRPAQSGRLHVFAGPAHPGKPQRRPGAAEPLSGRDAQIVLESIAGHGRPGTATAGYEGCVW